MIFAASKLIALFSPRERWRALWVLAAVVLMGLIQIAGVGSIIPFVSLLIDPGLVQEKGYLAWAYETFGFDNTQGFLFATGLLVLAILVLSNVFTAFTIWLMAQFAWDNQVYLSARLFERYLSRPYTEFLNRNSADIAKNILHESMQLTQGVVMPALNLLSSGVTTVFITGFLLWLNPVFTSVAALILVVSYALIYYCIKNPLYRVGMRRLTINTERFKSVAEAFGSVKEVKILGREVNFIWRYLPPAKIFARSVVIQQLLTILPRYLIEILAFGSVIVIFLYLLQVGADLQAVAPLASAFAFAAYRLLPALQRVYQSVSALRFNSSVLDVIHHDLTEGEKLPPPMLEPKTQRMIFTRRLCLEDVEYTYPGSEQPALKGVSMQIDHKAFIALVGVTGAGKTTLADIILGLLHPQSGQIIVDETKITDENLRYWQANLGYVPQEIYLTDDTVAANIAFGLQSRQIDQSAVERAAKIANIHEFIEGNLPQGYDTVVGERGVRLSGGQRQRIGIARALYHDPEVLVLDEATSALDSATEAQVHRAIVQAAAVKTVIIIAHRMATVRNCDCIYVLVDGQVVAAGNYDQLSKTSPEFRSIARDYSRAASTQA